MEKDSVAKILQRAVNFIKFKVTESVLVVKQQCFNTEKGF